MTFKEKAEGGWECSHLDIWGKSTPGSKKSTAKPCISSVAAICEDQKKAYAAGMKPAREKCRKCNKNVKGSGEHNLFVGPYRPFWGSLVAQMVKNPPAIQETQVQFLGWKDPLEKGMATHSSILAWRIPWTEEPGELLSMWSHRADTNERITLYFTSQDILHHDGNQQGVLLSRGLTSDSLLNRTTEATGVSQAAQW